MVRVRYAAIVLRSDPARVERVRALADIIPHLTVRDAVDKRTLPSLTILERIGFVAAGHELLTKGQVACALSHLALLREYATHDAKDDEDAWFVTLEDDIDVVDGFEARVEAVLASLPRSADACYLHVFDGREEDAGKQPTLEGVKGARVAMRMFATWGVAYKARGAARLAARLVPLAKAIDNVLADMVESKEVEAYVCLPPLLTSRGDLGPFEVHRREMRSTVWHDE